MNPSTNEWLESFCLATRTCKVTRVNLHSKHLVTMGYYMYLKIVLFVGKAREYSPIQARDKPCHNHNYHQTDYIQSNCLGQ